MANSLVVSGCDFNHSQTWKEPWRALGRSVITKHMWHSLNSGFFTRPSRGSWGMASDEAALADWRRQVVLGGVKQLTNSLGPFLAAQTCLYAEPVSKSSQPGVSAITRGRA